MRKLTESLNCAVLTELSLQYGKDYINSFEPVCAVLKDEDAAVSGIRRRLHIAV